MLCFLQFVCYCCRFPFRMLFFCSNRWYRTTNYFVSHLCGCLFCSHRCNQAPMGWRGLLSFAVFCFNRNVFLLCFDEMVRLLLVLYIPQNLYLVYSILGNLCCKRKNSFCRSISCLSSFSVGMYSMYFDANNLLLSCNTE